MNMTTQIASGYVVGAVLEHQWGCEQTNIDYFKIVRRAGQWLWLVPIGKKNKVETGFMSGTCEPDPVNVLDLKPIKRKLHVRDGRETGVAIEKGYGWCNLWDGKPSHWSSYA